MAADKASPDVLAEEFHGLLPEEAEFEVRQNAEEGRYMVCSQELEENAWFLLESPIVCWPLTEQEGEKLSDLPCSWCEACLRALATEEAEPSAPSKPRWMVMPPRLCESCVGLKDMLAKDAGHGTAEEELLRWRQWQQLRSPKSCIGLEAFGRCLAQVALLAGKAKEAGLNDDEALHYALRPFERLQGPPGDATVESLRCWWRRSEGWERRHGGFG
eukprot:g30411.t1